MTRDRSEIEGQLEAYVLDLVDPAEREEIEAAVAADPDLARRAEHLRGALADLAYDEQHDPPAPLRSAVLSGAGDLRRPGRAVGEQDASDPRACRVIMMESLLSLLHDLEDADFTRLTVYGESVEHLVRHLVAAEATLLQALADAEGSAALWDSPWVTDHLSLCDESAASPLAQLSTLAQRLTELLGHADRGEVDEALASALLTRAFEVWTHADDIRRAVERPLVAPSAAVLRAMAELAVSLTVPLAAEEGEQDKTMRLTLTGAGGGSWVCAVDDGAELEDSVAADAHLIADVVDFCRLAAARQPPERVLIDASGESILVERLLRRAPMLADFGAGPA